MFLISTCYVQLHFIVILLESNLNIPQFSLSLNYWYFDNRCVNGWAHFHHGSNGWVFHGDEENNSFYVYHTLISILLFFSRNKPLEKKTWTQIENILFGVYITNIFQIVFYFLCEKSMSGVLNNKIWRPLHVKPAFIKPEVIN